MDIVELILNVYKCDIKSINKNEIRPWICSNLAYNGCTIKYKSDKVVRIKNYSCIPDVARREVLKCFGTDRVKTSSQKFLC